MVKTADLNLEGYKSFSNYFCSGKFCQYAYDDKSPMCAHRCVLSENAVLFVKCHATKSKQS